MPARARTMLRRGRQVSVVGRYAGPGEVPVAATVRARFYGVEAEAWFLI
jgi:hypothetical protein